MLIIPLQPIPVQTVSFVVGGQNVRLSLKQTARGLFASVNVDGADVVASVICLDMVPIVCRDYGGFIGNLLFIDTQGSRDPSYDGLAGRYSLVYLDAAEYAEIV